MSKLRKLLLVAALCGVGAAATGCVSVTHSGNVTTVAFWERTSSTIDGWYHDSHENINSTFFNIRANLCNPLRNVDAAGYLVCYAGTDANNQGMAYSFVYWLRDWEQNRYGCLAISSLDSIQWEHISNGHDGCTH
jgi:predicted GH43/DUF377 family glycosyl hydrolase